MTTDAGAARRPRWWLGAGLVLLLLAAWAVAVATAAFAARSDLRIAEDHLRAAREAVTGLDVAAADEELAQAGERLADARRRLERPGVALAARLPVLGDDLRVARAVAEGADLVAGAGRRVTTAVLALPGGADALLPRDGRLPATELATLADPTASAARDILRAREIVASSPHTGLVAQVAAARADFLELVDPVAATVDDLAVVVAALPSFLGADEPKRYFLGAANPAELRGSGGFLGSYAIVTFDDGRLGIGGFGDLNDLEDVPLDELERPSPLPARYDAFGGAGRWKNLNMTPHFPAAAAAIEALWAHTHPAPVDGTIVVDPFALAALVELGAGHVVLPGGERVAADDVVAFVANEAYDDFDDPSERKSVLGEVAGAALLGFLEGAGESRARASLATLAELLSDRHLLVHASDPAVQAAFEALGADGGLPDGQVGDFLAVVVNSASNAKVDFYTSRHLDYRVDLLADGRARGELEVTFDNDAPAEGRPQHVLGPNVDRLDVGDNFFHLSTYCARSCTVEAADGGLTQAVVEEELGHPVANTWVVVPRGHATTIGARWDVADAWQDTDGRLVYRLTIRHQVTVPPTTLRVTVGVPEGFAPDHLPPGAEVRAGTVVYEDEVVGGDTQLEVRLRPR